MVVKIKICGIRTADDLLASLEADYIGLNFVEGSPRRIDIAEAKKLLEMLMSLEGIKPVPIVIFLDQPFDFILRVVKELNVNVVQLHGREGKTLIKNLKDKGLMIIKAVFPNEGLEMVEGLEELVDLFLVDSSVKMRTKGKVSESFDLKKLEGVIQQGSNCSLILGKPFFLSGGLTPDNVGEKIRVVRPYGVDVASGVEVEGKKSPELVKKFIQKVMKASSH